MNRLSLKFTSDPAHLKPVRRKVEAFCTAAGFDEKAAGDVGLCVNEALANITRHAYEGAKDKPVEIEAQYEAGTLEVKIRDWGNGRDPSNAPPKQDLMVPGGLGMECLRAVMDEMTFTKQPVGMLLEMKKSVGRRQ